MATGTPTAAAKSASPFWFTLPLSVPVAAEFPAAAARPVIRSIPESKGKLVVALLKYPHVRSGEVGPRLGETVTLEMVPVQVELPAIRTSVINC